MTNKNKIFITIGCFLLLVAIALSIWFFGATFTEFNAKERFEIAGLKSGFVPKGVCRLFDGRDLWLVSGYMADGSTSRVYVINEYSGETRYFTLKDQGSAITGQFGGIASNGKQVWLVSDGQVYCFNAADVLSVADAKSLQITDKFDTGINANFCFANSEILMVGESSSTADTTYALCFAVGSGRYGLQTDGFGRLAPVVAYSIPSKVRGMAVVGSKIYLSVDCGATHSKVYKFDESIMGTVSQVGNLSIMNTEVSLMALKEDNAVKAIKVPPRCEGLDVHAGQIFALFSSASKKGGFSRTQEKYVQSFTF